MTDEPPFDPEAMDAIVAEFGAYQDALATRRVRRLNGRHERIAVAEDIAADAGANVPERDLLAIADEIEADHRGLVAGAAAAVAALNGAGSGTPVAEPACTRPVRDQRAVGLVRTLQAAPGAPSLAG